MSGFVPVGTRNTRNNAAQNNGPSAGSAAGASRDPNRYGVAGSAVSGQAAPPTQLSSQQNQQLNQNIAGAPVSSQERAALQQAANQQNDPTTTQAQAQQSVNSIAQNSGDQNLQNAQKAASQPGASGGDKDKFKQMLQGFLSKIVGMIPIVGSMLTPLIEKAFSSGSGGASGGAQ